MRRSDPSQRPQTSESPTKRGRNVGLARAISKLGYCSRAQAAALISAGRVRLNGAVRRNAETPVHLGRDKIEVDEKHIRAAKKSIGC